MSPSAQGRQVASVKLRAKLLERLEARRPEIEQAILTRVYSVADPTEVGDPEYVAGLKAAVSSALGYSLSGIEGSSSKHPRIPAELFAQARQAARSGVSLDTVLRRYVAGLTLLDDFLIEEAEGERESLPAGALQSVLRIQSVLFDRLIAAISREYADEMASHRESRRWRNHTECVESLLAGELADAGELPYDVDGWHVGLVITGSGSRQEICDLAKTLDRRLLLVPRGTGTVWGWLGGRRRLGPEDVVCAMEGSDWPSRATVAVGEAAKGLSGWRLTHQQACAAWPVALRSSNPLVRYADVSLLAAALRDDVLAKSLSELYLSPLAQGRDGGALSRETLRAYFAAGHNVSSTAAALGRNRGTITSRLRSIEERLGCSLVTHAAEIDIALRLDELGRSDTPQRVEAISYLPTH